MNTIIVEATIASDIDKVWEYWIDPVHITIWNHASDDWECPQAENNLTVGGVFFATMAAKDGSFSFDFSGTYTEIIPLQKLAYVMPDGRKVLVTFEALSKTETKVTEEFDPETENPPERQREGWQAIMNNFKQHVETN
jgi:uncharacterized protein YndB with AHSA1/START domain